METAAAFFGRDGIFPTKATQLHVLTIVWVPPCDRGTEHSWQVPLEMHDMRMHRPLGYRYHVRSQVASLHARARAQHVLRHLHTSGTLQCTSSARAQFPRRFSRRLSLCQWKVEAPPEIQSDCKSVFIHPTSMPKVQWSWSLSCSSVCVVHSLPVHQERNPLHRICKLYSQLSVCVLAVSCFGFGTPRGCSTGLSLLAQL